MDNKTGGFRGGVLLGVELDLVGVEDVAYSAKILLHLNMDNDFFFLLPLPIMILFPDHLQSMGFSEEEER